MRSAFHATGPGSRLTEGQRFFSEWWLEENWTLVATSTGKIPRNVLNNRILPSSKVENVPTITTNIIDRGKVCIHHHKFLSIVPWRKEGPLDPRNSDKIDPSWWRRSCVQWIFKCQVTWHIWFISCKADMTSFLFRNAIQCAAIAKSKSQPSWSFNDSILTCKHKNAEMSDLIEAQGPDLKTFHRPV